MIAASRDGIARAGFLVCNFAAAFAHLGRLAEPHQQLASHPYEEPLQLVTALGLEPLRLLTPFWLFACLRDRRVYAPDAHVLFRVSAALTHTHPPLVLPQQPAHYHVCQAVRKQRILLLGCTRRLRRLRRPSGFGCNVFASDSDEGSDGGHAQPAAGHALALHDEEIIAACADALGGRSVSVAEVDAALEAPATCGTTADVLDKCPPYLDVDLVVVGHLAGLIKKSAALFAGNGARATTDDPPVALSPAQRRAAGAAAELSLLQKLQDRGVPCVRLQWLLDAYRFVSPPHDAPIVPSSVLLLPYTFGDCSIPSGSCPCSLQPASTILCAAACLRMHPPPECCLPKCRQIHPHGPVAYSAGCTYEMPRLFSYHSQDWSLHGHCAAGSCTAIRRIFCSCPAAA